MDCSCYKGEQICFTTLAGLKKLKDFIKYNDLYSYTANYNQMYINNYNIHTCISFIVLVFQSKPFVLLHPTSVFSYKPELLHPKHDTESGKHNPADLKGLLSNKHELLTFV
jgi:hypothetical protein